MKIYYDLLAQNVNFEGLGRFFASGSLEAVADGDNVFARYKGGDIKEIYENFLLIQKQDGSSAGANPADVVSYLNNEFNQVISASGITETTASIQAKRPLKTIAGQSLEGIGNILLSKNDVGLSNVDNTSDLNKPISTATQTAIDGKANASHTHTIADVANLQSSLDSKVDKNISIVSNTKTKVTYDSKGLVISGADATTADVSDSLDKRYITDAQKTIVNNTSGSNTGDNATNTQYSSLITNSSHTGDVVGANALTISNNVVTNQKLAQMPGSTIKGNNSGTSSNSADLTAAQVKSLLSISNLDITGLGTLSTQNGTFSGSSSNANTGDETTASIQSKRPLKTVNGNSIEGSGDIVISGGGGGKPALTLVKANATTITETVIARWAIPANSITALSSILAKVRLQAGGTATSIWRLRVGATGTITDTLLSQCNTSVAQVANAQGSGDFVVEFPTTTTAIGSGFAIMQNAILGTTTAAGSTATIVPAALVYVSVTMQLSAINSSVTRACVASWNS